MRHAARLRANRGARALVVRRRCFGWLFVCVGKSVLVAESTGNTSQVIHDLTFARLAVGIRMK